MTLLTILLFNGLILLGSIFFLYRRFIHITRQQRVFELLREQMDELLRELNQITDKNVTLLEIKIESLTSLLKEADKRLESFDKKLEAFHRSEEDQQTSTPFLYSRTPLHTNSDSSVSFLPSVDPSLEALKRIRRQGQPESQRSRVLGLAAEGLSYDIIAKRLQMELGEVELIVSLHRGVD